MPSIWLTSLAIVLGLALPSSAAGQQDRCEAAKHKVARKSVKRLARCAAKDLKGVLLGDACDLKARDSLERDWKKVLDRYQPGGACPGSVDWEVVQRWNEEFVRETRLLIQDLVAPVSPADEKKTRAVRLKIHRRMVQWARTYHKQSAKQALLPNSGSFAKPLDRALEKITRELDRVPFKRVAVDSDLDFEMRQLRNTFLAYAFGVGYAGPHPFEPAAWDLLLYLDFDEAQDSAPAQNRAPTGSDFDAALAGGATRAAGKFGRALSLDGSGDSARISDADALAALESVDAITVSAWIYPTGPGSHASAGGVIVNKEGEFMVARFADGSIRMAYGKPDDSWSWMDTGVTAPPFQWTHLLVVFPEPPGQIYRVFKNGGWTSFVGDAGGGDAHPGEDQLWIGSRQNQAQDFDGLIDDVAIWGTALSSTSGWGTGAVAVLFGSGLGYPIVAP